MRRLIILTLVFIMAEQALATSTFSIDQVTISPANPTSLDTITIDANGWVNFGGWSFDHSSFTANDTDLTLDFYFDVPDTVYWVFTQWDESKQIGTLSANDYDLTVNTYSITSSGTGLENTYTTSFTVATPEPMTICLLGLGAVMLRKTQKRK
jgi:hypothetical protein